jgi:hypothetical protein
MNYIRPSSKSSNRRGKRFAILGAAVFAVGVAVVCGVGISFFRTVRSETAEAHDVVSQFLDDLSTGRLQQAYESTTTAMRQNVEYADFKSTLSGFGDHDFAPDFFRLSTINGKTQAWFKLQLPEGTAYIITMKEAGRWKVHHIHLPQ